MTTDVVCGMKVDPKTAAASSEHQGKTYYFCAPGCKAAFDRDPAAYVAVVQGAHNHPHDMTPSK